ncbi:hypothetical protein J5N58_13790 [Rhizobium cremeum]|uniref:hypothetical protein n=1 Tax=Rhizobium cremeum TaxID=2813827 RepID=UPI000DDD8CAD|nr:hypothetical protein [Rhizobium cremeum]MCJ7994937.1 hypothetical protein [Rhizobium cremeum]MCJ8000751.1 hypothetical protein [Rhizobium cremeum]
MSRKSKRNRLQKLQNSWEKASEQQRYAFLQWLGGATHVSDGDMAGEANITGLLSGSPIASGRYLMPSSVARIRAIMAARSLSASEVMAEIGFEEDGTALERALSEGACLRLAIVAALQKWLVANRGH